jgi:hypothetical protein
MSEHNPEPIGDPAPAPDTGPAEPEGSPAPAAPEIEGDKSEKSDLTSTDSAAPSAESASESEPPEPAVEAPAEKATALDASEVAAANEAVLAESRKHTRRAFVAAAAGAAAGYGFYRWIDQSSGIEMQPGPFRRAFQANAAIAHGVFRDHALTPTYSLREARDLRVNGVYGLKKMLVAESWRLQLVGVQDAATHPQFSNDVTGWECGYVDAQSHEDQGHDTKVDPNARTAEKMAPMPMMDQAKAEEDRAMRMPRGKEEAGESSSTLMPQTPGLLLTIDDLLKLPRHELVTQFKCIEGWSEIVHWAGIRMADFMEAYPPTLIDGSEPKYVYMETPDGDYYTGYDLNVCRHPQTLLVTEMMGAPLTQYHGAPLRLHMPTKYGYKQIKRIGLIAYTNRKPDDYWTKLGYDWYAGL